jgi:hypothetical protein
MDFVFAIYVHTINNCMHLHRLHDWKIGVLEMFLTFVFEIFSPLSLSVLL